MNRGVRVARRERMADAEKLVMRSAPSGKSIVDSVAVREGRLFASCVATFDSFYPAC